MKYLTGLSILIVVLLFGFSSISQSYATATQAQAAIEASRAAQIAGIGNLSTILVTVLIVVAVLALGVFMVYLEFKGIPYRKSKGTSTANLPHHFEQNSNGLLPAMMTIMMYEMLRQQQETQQYTMLDLSNPEIPAMTNHNDFWNM